MDVTTSVFWAKTFRCFFVYTFNSPYSLQRHGRCESEAVFSMASVYKAHISLLLYYKAYYLPQLMLSGVFSVLIYFFKDILLCLVTSVTI